jgi:hypothetical protein
VTTAQVLVFGLLLSVSAGGLELDFSSILAFLRSTMESEASQISWASISRLLLCIALSAGFIQLWRRFAAARE